MLMALRVQAKGRPRLRQKSTAQAAVPRKVSATTVRDLSCPMATSNSAVPKARQVTKGKKPAVSCHWSAR